MKKIFGILLSIFCFLFLAGCQGEKIKKPPVSLVQLPPGIAGVWKAENSPWQIVLSKDGRVTSAILPLGVVQVKPNQTTIIEMKDGKKSSYTAGNFDVQYRPENRELEITIEMKKIHVAFMDSVIDGNSVDIFTGLVSNDGKIWETTWVNIFDYGPTLPQDLNDIGAESLRFNKEDANAPVPARP